MASSPLRASRLCEAAHVAPRSAAIGPFVAWRAGTHSFRSGVSGRIARVILAAMILGATSQLAAQSPVEHLAFDRPESWALKYFSSVSTFTGLGSPVVREPWSVELGLEAGWIPHLSDSQRRVGFDGMNLEDLNKTPVFGRPRVAVGLPGGLSAELGWVPPVEINGQKTNLLAGALERPFLDRADWTLGLRLYGQVGYATGDFTCSTSVASQPPGSNGNPLGCNGPSRDTARLNNAGAALTGGVKIGAGGALHFAVGATYNDLAFQVGAVEFGFPDDTRLATHGWTGWAAAGVGWPLGRRLGFSVEAFYSPLNVVRPPRQDAQNDGLFNVRALLRYRVF